MMRFGLVLLLLLPACRNKDTGIDDTGSVTTTDSATEVVDLDGDGSPADVDCDDSNGAVYPGNTETPYNGLDDDCDEATPDDDLDGDGAGLAEDCDDEDPDRTPGATEVCDGKDNDCNGHVDDAVGDLFYADEDTDGYGDPDASVQSCQGATGYVADDTDCDDTDPEVNPGMAEVCNGLDDDCDLLIDDEDPDLSDPGTWYRDGDEDGFGDDALTVAACEVPEGYTEDAGDCDDSDAAVNPDAEETCNGVDDDCDGLTDGEDDSVTGLTTWWLDGDGDGHGGSAYSVEDCDAPEGFAETADDCDDGDAATFPGANEACDGVDNDCDTEVDENATDAGAWYADTDGDGYGDPDASTLSCDGGTQYVADDTDCDDTDAAVSPGATEVCNGLDDDCDTLVDDDDPDVADPGTFHADLDGDGYGDPDSTTVACDQPSNTVADDSDCDDSDATAFPGATETCDGDDEDCDALVDDDDPDVTGQTTSYLDLDGDGYGNASYSLQSCEVPSGYVVNDLDCDDAHASANPLGTEVCDGLDNDCDSDVDEDLDVTYYADADGDGHGDPDASLESCSEPSGYVTSGTDCDDTDPAISPVATEVCDGADNDCDGTTDQDAVDAGTWYADADGDSFGDVDASSTSCEAGTQEVADDTDCDDSDAADNPDASEVCNDTDDDCDGHVDDDDPDVADASTFYADDDGDGYGDAGDARSACEAPSGYVADDQDCDDAHPEASPAGTEVCDGLDNDCDGDIDDGLDQTWYADTDGDGHGDPDSTTVDCSEPSGHVSDATDCDDTDPAISPVATEVCDGVDNDCDGSSDTDAVDAGTWYADTDGDGHGDAGSTTVACEPGSGWAETDGDCDDGDAAVNPDAIEICDGLDNDCDGDADSDATDATTWYLDYDEDGFGGATVSTTSCDAPTGYVADATDCDDLDSAVNPDGTETCNAVDDDCDGVTDPDDSVDAPTWYADTDGDGYGDASASSTACLSPSGTVEDDSDCDDTNGDVHPGATETCNGLDDDCDAVADNGALGTDATCAADDCAAILADDASAASDTYYLDSGSGAYSAVCDMTTDGGGWTLLGSIVNDGSRSWNSLDAFTDPTTWGDAGTWESADYKGEAWYGVVAEDFLVRTEEYAVAWSGLLAGSTFADWVYAEYDTSGCSTTYLGGTPDYSESLTTSEVALFDVIVRAWDDNASCFPDGNENALVSFTLSTCCWTNGLGNTPNGYATWEVYDNSMLLASQLVASSCTPGDYPCNGAGYEHNSSYNCYDESCKTTYGAVWVR